MFTSVGERRGSVEWNSSKTGRTEVTRLRRTLITLRTVRFRRTSKPWIEFGETFKGSLRLVWRYFVLAVLWLFHWLITFVRITGRRVVATRSCCRWVVGLILKLFGVALMIHVISISKPIFGFPFFFSGRAQLIISTFWFFIDPHLYLFRIYFSSSWRG